MKSRKRERGGEGWSGGREGGQYRGARGEGQ